MSPDSSKSSNEEPIGVRREMGAISGGLASYLRTRLELFGIEAKEASHITGRKVAAYLGAIFFGLIGYLLLLITLTHLLGSWLEKTYDLALANWAGAALIFALLHFIITGALILIARKKNPTPLFEYTKSEWEKDRQWLQNDQTKKN